MRKESIRVVTHQNPIVVGNPGRAHQQGDDLRTVHVFFPHGKVEGGSSLEVGVGLGVGKGLDEALDDGVLVRVVAGVVQREPAVDGPAHREAGAIDDDETVLLDVVAGVARDLDGQEELQNVHRNRPLAGHVQNGLPRRAPGLEDGRSEDAFLGFAVGIIVFCGGARGIILVSLGRKQTLEPLPNGSPVVASWSGRSRRKVGVASRSLVLVLVPVLAWIDRAVEVQETKEGCPWIKVITLVVVVVFVLRSIVSPVVGSGREGPGRGDVVVVPKGVRSREARAAAAGRRRMVGLVVLGESIVVRRKAGAQFVLVFVAFGVLDVPEVQVTEALVEAVIEVSAPGEGGPGFAAGDRRVLVRRGRRRKGWHRKRLFGKQRETFGIDVGIVHIRKE